MSTIKMRERIETFNVVYYVLEKLKHLYVSLFYFRFKFYINM